ncbi:MAG: transporter substrate-binding domain-containing protein, partial [Desulfurivibrionaceae bacterium]|nr:transporter substrate-binding domain-containing protein [Desulfurivibrionaceae bacterium]
MLCSLAGALLCVLLLAPGARAQAPISSAAEVDYPPFSMVDDQNRATGFSVELLEAALVAMGQEVSFRLGPWSQVKGWLAQGEIRALPLAGRTPEREGIFDFTFPYMALHGAIVVRKGSKGIEDLEDLKGRQVAVMQGDNTEEFLRRQDRGIHIHVTPTFEDALDQLAAGRHDAVVIQRLVALRLIQEGGFTNLQVIKRPLAEFRQDFCFAVRDGDRETLALLNEGLALVMADGTYSHLHAKWFAALELPTHRRIVIGGDHDYPPFEYLDEQGLPAGYNVDLSRAIAREMGLSIEIRLGPWAEIREALERGEIDALQGMYYSQERELIVDFSQAHMVNHHVGVVREGAGNPPVSLAELAGKRLVVQRGDIMHDYALAHGLEAQLVVVDTAVEALRALARGRYDCALVSRLTARYWIKKEGWDNLRVGSHSLLTADYGYAVPQGHKALLAQLGEGLKVLEITGDYRRIHEKWLGVYAEAPSYRGALRYFTLAVLFLLSLMVGVLLWSWALRRQVANRTQALQKSERKYRILFENMTAGFALHEMIYDLEGRPVDYRFLEINPAFEKMTGTTAQQVIGRTVREIMPATEQYWLDTYGEVARTGEPTAFENYAREMGRFFDVWAFSPGPDRFAVVFTDITSRKQAEQEREKLQEQLIQAQKMESVGRLAGGVAHDFNNMLSVILGYAELAGAGTSPGEPLYNDLAEIRKAAQRSADITRQLLAFARKQTIDPEVLDLNERVAHTLKMLQRLIGEDIELAFLPGAALWPVKMDPSQLDQLLANLCVNARDAIAGIGRITIETGTKTLDAAFCADHVGSVAGDFVQLVVSDDGCGMDRETLAHIFEPFFTTKELGQGTGLGLATVYGIVKQNNGYISAYSEPGEGTTFSLYLPRFDGENQVTAP